MKQVITNFFRFVTHRNAHTILGVTLNASKEEVKKAYYTLAKQYHPDRNPHLKSTDLFQRITKAYDIMMNKTQEETPQEEPQQNNQTQTRKTNRKKQTYSNFDEFNQFEQEIFKSYQSFKKTNKSKGNSFKSFQQFFIKYATSKQNKFSHKKTQQMFQDQFQDEEQSQQSQSQFQINPKKKASFHKGLQITIDLQLTEAEANRGVMKSVKLKKKIICNSCNGNPAVKKTKCKKCKGTGLHYKGDNMEYCRACGGSKTVKKAQCNCCLGKGHINKEVEELIYVKPGVKNNEELIVSGKGNQHLKKGFFGNLIVRIKLAKVDSQQKDEYNQDFKQDGYNTFATIRISLMQAIFGSKIFYKTIWGERSIILSEGIQDGVLLKRRGEGLKKKSKNQNGDHFITIKVEIPTKLGPEELKILEQLKVIMEKKDKKKEY